MNMDDQDRRRLIMLDILCAVFHKMVAARVPDGKIVEHLDGLIDTYGAWVEEGTDAAILRELAQGDRERKAAR